MRIRLYIATVLLAWAAVAGAHQPYESNAVARLDREHLELIVTTSAEIAGMLVGAPMSDTAALDNLRPELLKAGAELYKVTATGKPLQPKRVFFTGKGGEATFSVIYPVIHTGILQFRAVYLDKLPLGYGGSIEVFDEAGNLLGRQPLLKKGETKDTFSVELPETVSNPVDTPSRAASSAQSRTTVASEPANTAAKRTQLPLVAGICAVVLLARIAWHFRQKSDK